MKSDKNIKLVPHFLQGEAWAGFQRALGKEVVRLEGDGWQVSAVLEAPSGLGGKPHRRLYAPYGPSAASEKSLKVALEALQQAGKEYRVSYVRVEPIVASQPDGNRLNWSKFGLHPNSRAFQPDRTLLLDLRPGEEELLQGMSSTNRNLWRTYKNKGISMHISYNMADLTPFLAMLHETAKRTGIITHDDDYFAMMAESLFPGKHAGLAYAEHEGKPIVAAIFFDDILDGTRYYAHAGSFDAARKLQANSPLLTYLIMDAKTQGRQTFDFYGVAPPDAGQDHPWSGHSRFKRSFGGQDKIYSGTWELPINKNLFKAAKLTRKLASLKPKRH
jgi:lipid II:glycine glycyltransferase (peptidoglycan interpeptide bridge formation enzyme)